MVSGRHKSRTFRRVSRKTPGGRTVLYYKRRKPAKAKCGSCKAVLQGVSRALPTKMMNTAKTDKRPTRPYGGNLCSRCMRKKILESVRK